MTAIDIPVVSPARKKTSIVIDQELWKNAKKAAIDQSIDLSVLVERALADALKNRKGVPKDLSS